jgi:hypothetical protein
MLLQLPKTIEITINYISRKWYVFTGNNIYEVKDFHEAVKVRGELLKEKRKKEVLN